MCDMHYRRVKKHGDPLTRLTMLSGDCSTSGCSLPTFGRGLCRKHHYRMWIDAGGRAKKAAAIARRRAREAGAGEVDATLSWVALWQAGHRECHICQAPCDPTDYRTITNRAGRSQKICGARHPSLDHVVPLMRGGSHTSDNVALACLGCNWRKWASLGREAQHRDP